MRPPAPTLKTGLLKGIFFLEQGEGTLGHTLEIWGLEVPKTNTNTNIFGMFQVQKSHVKLRKAITFTIIYFDVFILQKQVPYKFFMLFGLQNRIVAKITIVPIQLLYII